LGAGVSTFAIAKASTVKPSPSPSDKFPSGSSDKDFTRGILLTFDDIPTALAPFQASPDQYLAQFGVSVANADGRVVAMRDEGAYNGSAFVAVTRHNVLTMVDCAPAPASFTLRFKGTLSRVAFERPSLLAGPQFGISHPAWTATAFDESGNQIGMVEENIIRSLSPVAAASFKIEGRRIAAVRFTSDNRLDGKPFTAFCAVLLDDLTLYK
jgi:hypothetical protein